MTPYPQMLGKAPKGATGSVECSDRPERHQEWGLIRTTLWLVRQWWDRMNECHFLR